MESLNTITIRERLVPSGIQTVVSDRRILIGICVATIGERLDKDVMEELVTIWPDDGLVVNFTPKRTCEEFVPVGIAFNPRIDGDDLRADIALEESEIQPGFDPSGFLIRLAEFDRNSILTKLVFEADGLPVELVEARLVSDKLFLNCV